MVRISPSTQSSKVRSFEINEKEDVTPMQLP